MIDSFNIADCFSLLDVWTVWSCICEKLLLYFEGQVTHMTKTNTIQVIDELAELAEHPSPPPPHTRSCWIHPWILRIAQNGLSLPL